MPTTPWPAYLLFSRLALIAAGRDLLSRGRAETGGTHHQPGPAGLGLSDFKKGFTIREWPEDVLALAGELALERFAVVGVSSGAPLCLCLRPFH